MDRGRDVYSGLLPILFMALVALIYTTPWDNYLVANRIWWYRPDWVLGATLGWVPVEEYTFFVLQTILTGGWTLFVMRRRATTVHLTKAESSVRLRWMTGLCITTFWLASLIAWLAGPPRWTYLALILVWALPPLILQAAFGADLLWQRARLLLLSIGLPSIYLILADALAIRTGTWVINPSLSLSTRVAGFPLEEALFFVVTNTMIGVGLGLWFSEAGRARALDWLRRLGLTKGAPGSQPAETPHPSALGGSHERA
jgi:lycopene cyclase domain-containing protein